MKNHILLMMFGVLCVFCAACGSESQWTPEEKLNFNHFLNAQNAGAAAVRLSTPGMPSSAISPNTSNEILQLMKKALEEAQTTRDEVLAKAHPDLPEHFRREFQRGLELQIRNLEVGDASAELEGSSLQYKWIYWINSHNSDIKVPN